MPPISTCACTQKHVPSDIILMGPPRTYWCFVFESYMRRVKKYAQQSNRKNTIHTVAMMCSLQFGLGILP